MIEEILILGTGAALLRSYLPSVFGGLASTLTPAALPAKDPTDLTLTPSSTAWESEKFCPVCKSSVVHSEQMSGICNSCGTIGTILSFKSRTFRQIWDGSAWVYQYNYDNDPNHMEIRKDKPTFTPVVPQPTPAKRTRIRANTGPK